MEYVVSENKVLAASYLLKKNRFAPTWTKRWVVLRNCQLSYYPDSKEIKPIEVINKNQLLRYNISSCKLNMCEIEIYISDKRIVRFRTTSSDAKKWSDALLKFFKKQLMETLVKQSASSTHREIIAVE